MNVTILPRKAGWGWPESKIAQDLGKIATELESGPLSEALIAHHETDAHFTIYSSFKPGFRLNKEAIGLGDIFVCWFVVDVDAPGKNATNEWLEAEGVKCLRLLDRHPGAFWYATCSGYRLVYAHAPFSIASKEDEALWKARYEAYVRYLRSEFEIVADPAMSTWNQLVK